MWRRPIGESQTACLAEATGICESTDNFCEMVPAEQEPLNSRFLRALEKTRGIWDSDRQFKKIVDKMEKGKNLDRKEFDKVHFYLREPRQY